MSLADNIFIKMCQVERLLTISDETYTWVNYMTHGFPPSCLFFTLQLHLKLAKEWCTKESREQFHKRIVFVILLFESHHWCNGHELGQTSGDGEGQGSLACCSSWGCKKSDTAVWLRDNNKYQCLRLVGSQVVLYSPSLFCLLLYSDLKIINKNYELHM